MLELVDINQWPSAAELRWQLLQLRTPEQSISHSEMPSWPAHCAFIRNHPYEAWYVVSLEGRAIGTIYLTKSRGPSVAGDEIGVEVLPGCGCYAKDAVHALMRLHTRDRFLGNVGFNDTGKQDMFEAMGFHPIQITFAWERNDEL